MYQVGRIQTGLIHLCPYSSDRDVTRKKFEPRVANVDLLSVVVNAEMMVDHTRHILMTF